MLSEEELEKWEAGRDLLKEIEDGIDEMKNGKEISTRVVEVSEEVHKERIFSTDRYK